MSLTRRHLLGAAAGFPMIWTQSAHAAAEVGIGFIGVKNRGMQNLGPLMQHCVAVCDVDQNVLASAKKTVETKTGRTIRAYSDFRRLLEDPIVKAVVISTPDHWHALMTVAACEAGKDVYCEKPLSLTIREGREMVKAARKHTRVVQTGSQQRSDTKFRQACEAVRSGRIGKLQSVKVGIPTNNFKNEIVPDGEPPAELNFDMWLGPAPKRAYNVNRVHYNFRFFWDYSGGQMTNFGAHHLDIAQWGLGMDESGPVEIDGKMRLNPGVYYETPDWCHINYRYANGVVVECGQDFKGGATFEGSDGWIFVTRGKIQASKPEILSDPAGPSDVRLYASDDHYKNWLECLETRKKPICDVEIGHRSATVCHLGNLAARTGQTVKWDPVREEITSPLELKDRIHYGYRKPWTL